MAGPCQRVLHGTHAALLHMLCVQPPRFRLLLFIINLISCRGCASRASAADTATQPSCYERHVEQYSPADWFDASWCQHQCVYPPLLAPWCINCWECPLDPSSSSS